MGSIGLVFRKGLVRFSWAIATDTLLYAALAKAAERRHTLYFTTRVGEYFHSTSSVGDYKRRSGALYAWAFATAAGPVMPLFAAVAKAAERRRWFFL